MKRAKEILEKSLQNLDLQLQEKDKEVVMLQERLNSAELSLKTLSDERLDIRNALFALSVATLASEVKKPKAKKS